MKRLIAYLIYVIRHKWFVAIECFKVGIPWRGIVHDISKLGIREFWPYAKFFYDSDGNRTVNGDARGFDVAWFWHQARNKHHWQYWCMPEDGGRSMRAVEIPDKYRKEMICDWIGAGKAQGNNNVKLWYLSNRNKIVFHPRTRVAVEYELGLINMTRYIHITPLANEEVEEILREIRRT